VTDESLQPVLSHYGLPAPQVHIEPLANAGGWSGSLLWRITDASGHHFCLRRWPLEYLPRTERLKYIHRVLLHVAPELPIIASPLRTKSGETFIDYGGHFWEITNWLPGVADFRRNPSRGRLRAAIHVLANFHVLAAGYSSHGPFTGPAPAIAERLKQLAWINRHPLSTIEQSLATPLKNEIDLVAVRLFAGLKHRLSRALPPCPISATARLHLQPAIRDIHRDHVLFTGEDVTGLIDFGAMRSDTPLTDIARLIGSLVADDLQARQTALDAYSELRPLSDADRQLIDWLDYTAVTISARNWLHWLYVERRDMGPPLPIVSRMSELTLRLEKQSA